MLIITPKVEKKLKDKHGVSRQEVIECLTSHTGHFMFDDREEHATWPPTEWFIGATDEGRRLKVVFIAEEDQTITLKTAYEPSRHEERIYAAAR